MKYTTQINNINC